jgi:hypothetical protein
MMQKNILGVIFLLMISFSSDAQLTPAKKTIPHPVTDSVANAMCSCMMTNVDTLVTLNSFYAALDHCLKINSSPRIDALLKEDGYTEKDDRKSRADAIRNVGRKLGKQVTAECPGFKELLNSLIAKENKPALH